MIQIKKTEHNQLSAAEQRRCEDIIKIQSLLADGFAPVQIKEMLHTTYFRIRRYATGDPVMLCRFGGDKHAEADQYREEIIERLTQNLPLKQVKEQIDALGYQGKRTAFGVYCRNLVAELDIPYMPRKNSTGVPVSHRHQKPAQHYVTKADFIKHLWSGKDIPATDIAYIVETYPQISEIQQCIMDFRKIYMEKSVALLEQFIERYAASLSKPLSSFASGLRSDIDAVKNSVTSDLSNGFVEGISNKIKLIKRMMFGRAKIDLLRARVIFAR